MAIERLSRFGGAVKERAIATYMPSWMDITRHPLFPQPVKASCDGKRSTSA
jgi:hypothetical protein